MSLLLLFQGIAASSSLGQPVETDTAQPITGVKVRTLGQAVEGDSAQAITRSGGATNNKVLVIGDSIAYELAGTDDILHLSELFGVPRTRGLSDLGYQVINAALPGTGCAREDTNYPLTWADTHYAASLVAAYNPAKVVVHFGGNNHVWSDGSKTAEEPMLSTRWQLLSWAGYQDIINDLLNAGIAQQNICIVSHLRAVWFGNPANAWSWSIYYFGEFVRNNALGLWPNVKMVDAYDLDPYDGRLRTPDTIHLTDAGSLLLAQRIATAFSPLPPTVPPTPPQPERPKFTVSAQFATSRKQSSREVTRIDVLRTDLSDPVGQLAVIDGSITLSAGDTLQRSAQITAVDADRVAPLTPDLASDILSPFTCELSVWMGPKYADGTEELVPCGIFKVTKLNIAEKDGALTFEVTCFDRSIRAQRPFGEPWIVIAGTPLEVAIADMLRSVTPTVPFIAPDTGLVAPNLILADTTNPWSEATRLANLSGYDLKVNRSGAYEMDAAVITASDVAAWVFEEGTRSDFWNPRRAIDGDRIPNHVIVRSSNTTAAAVKGEAFDNDPTSVTFIGGHYGDFKKVIKDERITSIDQAQRAAERILSRELGTGEQIPLEALSNPALDLNTTVRIERTALGLAVNALTDQINLSLTPDKPMSVTTRRSVLTDKALVGALVPA